MALMYRLSSWLRREWPSLILGGVLCALVLNCLLGVNGPRDLLLLRQRRAQLEAQRERLVAEGAQLAINVQNLRSDDKYLEHLIRIELGFVRSNEIVYKFGAPPAGGNP